MYRLKLDQFLTTKDRRTNITKPFSHRPEDPHEEAVDYFFNLDGRKAHNWQLQLVRKVLQGGWKPKRDDTALFSSELKGEVAKNSQAALSSRIVGHLFFPDLPDREHQIVDAHQSTSEWIFSGPTNQHVRKWCLFSAWLRSSEKVYWITGKPGSGKSTLMKFISQHPQTRSNLSAWSEGLPLLTVYFYFWNSGGEVQMSLHGFFRTVVYTILSKNPSLVKESFARRWEHSMLVGDDTRDWTLKELSNAFHDLLQRSGTQYKLCLFIDGLDEYNGNHQEFVDLLSTVISRNNVKLCVASRPWPVFENAFSTGSHLMLQDLTFPDIVRFTWERFHSHRGFQNLLILEAEYAGKLALEISRKADGVFLWVHLVTKSLLEGLTNADRVADLQRRLEELPGELEELYAKMFESIDRTYRERASRYFQIAAVAAGHLSALTLFFADEEDRMRAFNARPRPLTEEMTLASCQTIKTRLAASCKGFLEIPNPAPLEHSEGSLLGDPPFGGNEGCSSDTYTFHNDKGKGLAPDFGSHAPAEPDPRALNNWTRDPDDIVAIAEANRKVTYLHRTAKDYLESANMKAKILSMSRSGFEAQRFVLNAQLLTLRSLPRRSITRMTLWEVVNNFLGFAALAKSQLCHAFTEYVDELDTIATEMFREYNLCEENQCWADTRWNQETPHYESGFLALVAEFKLPLYLKAKIDSGKQVFNSSEGRPDLEYAIGEYSRYPSLCESPPRTRAQLPSLSIIKSLLGRGDDPNLEFRHWTAWLRMLNQVQIISNDMDSEDTQKKLVFSHWVDIMEAFIRHGGDPLTNRDSPIGSHIREILGPTMPQRARTLEKLLKSTRSRWSSIGKFITPRNRKLEQSVQTDSTPLPVFNRLESVRMGQVPWHHAFPHNYRDGTEPKIAVWQAAAHLRK